MSEHALRPASTVVEAGRPPRVAGGPVNPAVSLSSTYHAGAERGYAREGTPTTDAFEAVVGALDGGEAISFASGVAAVAAVLDGLPTGAVVVAPASMYWGSVNLLRTAVDLGRLQVREVDVADTDDVVRALTGADLVWLETLTNPLMVLADVPAICAAARAQSVLSCVDATFATPLRQRPLAMGADLVMHSATKYLSGHSDALMGVLVTADAARARSLRDQRARTGAFPGALESYLATRGVRTLDVRLARAEANARELAGRLSTHPAVARVRYPGLADDPEYDRAQRLLDGPGAMLGVELTGGVDAADALCERVALITHATSLGGVESLIERRAKYAGEQSIGTPAGLIRLSVGIEDVEDLWADLSQALS